MDAAVVCVSAQTLGFMEHSRRHRAQRKPPKSAKQVAVATAAARRRVAKAERLHAKWLESQVVVNAANLRPTNSFGTPDFVKRGYYIDFPFRCKDCGKSEVWTPTQQRWWYEIAKGDVWTVAIRCRPCRLRERARSTAAREAAEAGMANKRSTKPNKSLERTRRR
jgi:hypothetical protein